MTLTDATGASDSRAKRYLVKDIFNIAIGEDELNSDCGSHGELQEQCEWLANAKDLEELKSLYKQAYATFEASPGALKQIIAAKNSRRKELE